MSETITQAQIEQSITEWELKEVLESSIPQEKKDEFIRLKVRNSELRNLLDPIERERSTNNSAIEAIRCLVGESKSEFKIGDTIEFKVGFKGGMRRGKVVNILPYGGLRVQVILKSGEPGKVQYVSPSSAKKVEVAK